MFDQQQICQAQPQQGSDKQSKQTWAGNCGFQAIGGHYFVNSHTEN